jgi:hypothetical protein
MKNYLALLSVCALICFSACRGNTDQTPDEKTSVDKVAPGTRDSPNVNDADSNPEAAQMAYICPMKCEGSASDKPGKCPVCGMDLVKNTDHGKGKEVQNHEPMDEQSKGTDDKQAEQPH